MPWVPIAESGVDWVFVSDYAELDGSDVVAEAQLGPWTISFSEPQTVRATAVEYTSGGGCPWEGGAQLGDQGNLSVSPQTEWAPSVVEQNDTSSFGYYNPNGGECAVVESFRFAIEVWVEDAACFWTDLIGVTQECD